MIRKMLVAVGVAALAGLSSSALADVQVYFSSVAPGGAYGGGAFNFSIVDVFGPGTAEHGVGSNFKTFCLETGENVSIGGTYWSTVEKSVIHGRPEAGGYGNGGTPAEEPTLFGTTSALYSAFRHNGLGSVPGYGADTNRDANAMQAAIWVFQHQATQDWVNGAYDVLTESLIAALQTYATNAVAANSGWNSSKGDVTVLNLYTGTPGNQDNTYVQSELALVPLPAETTMAGLGLMGLVGVRAVRRRRA